MSDYQDDNNDSVVDEEEEEIMYLEDRIQDLMKIYKEEYKKYTKMQNVTEEKFGDNSDSNIVLQYEKEKKYLDDLIKQFIDLITRFSEYEKEHEIGKDILKEKDKFENDFVTLNCEIQQIRSDNENLLDEIKTKQQELDGINKRIHEKASLIQIIESRIEEISKNK